MSESQLRRKVIDALRHWHAVSVENHAHPGTPDVNYVDGWLELKEIEKYPAPGPTIVQLPHFTKQQRAWLHCRLRAGGRAHVLLRVLRPPRAAPRSRYVLLPALWAAQHLGHSTRGELLEAGVSWGRDFQRNLPIALGLLQGEIT